MSALEDALALVDGWEADRVAACVIGPAGPIVRRGDEATSFRWASVTKLATALAVLVAVDRRLIDLDEAAGPPGATVRHLLAHTSGLPFEGQATLAAPGTRRIYSNPAYDLLGALVADRTGGPFERSLAELVLDPLGMRSTALVERPSQGLHGTIGDLALLASEFLQPTLLVPGTSRAMTQVAFEGLVGVVPGVGRFDPCDWGLGPEIHGAKAPHWMGLQNAPEAFGHFGGSGTFLWVDPVARVGLALLTDREFGPWALAAWPSLSDAVLAASEAGQASV